MKEYTFEELRTIVNRKWANPKDKHVGNSSNRGHDRSSEAIGGHYGIAWDEVFESSSGELYKVYCYDGTNRSKGAYREEESEEVIKPKKTDSKFCTLGELLKYKEGML